MTFLLSCMTCSTNSGLSSSSYIFSRHYKFSSFVRGRIIVQQSLSLKNDFMSLLILFFCSTPSEKPFYGYNAFSRYSFEVMGSPSKSINYSAKSLTTHMKDGKYYPYSSGSISSVTPVDFKCMCLVKLITSERFESAFSSILPTLLYMKYDDINIAIENIRTSWLESSSNAPKPSVSSTSTLIGSPSGVNPWIGFPQIHTP